MGRCFVFKTKNGVWWHRNGTWVSCSFQGAAQISVPLLSLGDGASSCCMDQSRLQLDPGSVFFWWLSIDHLVGAWRILGGRDLSRMLVFPWLQGKNNSLGFPFVSVKPKVLLITWAPLMACVCTIQQDRRDHRPVTETHQPMASVHSLISSPNYWLKA